MATLMRHHPYVLYSQSSEPGLDLPWSAKNYHRRFNFKAFESWEEGLSALHTRPPLALIVCLTPELLRNATFRRLLRDSLQLAEETEAFRLYIYLSHMTMADLDRVAQADELIDDLYNTINLSQKGRQLDPERSTQVMIDDIAACLTSYLDKVVDIIDTMRYRQLLRRMFGYFSFLSFVLSAFGLICAIATLNYLFEPTTAAISPATVSLLSLGLGVFIATALLLSISNASNRLLLILFAGVAIMATVKLDFSWLWVLQGGLLTVPTDHFRRVWIGLLPIVLSTSERDTETEWRSAPAKQSQLRFFGGEIWPRDEQVFVSYGRGSWADAKAETNSKNIIASLRDDLAELGIGCFLDVTDIELGSCWRHALEDGIRHCTLLLFFNHSNLRRWQKAELLATIRKYGRTGTPVINVIVEGQPVPTLPSSARERLPMILGSDALPILPLPGGGTRELAQQISERSISAPATVMGLGGHWYDGLIALVFQLPLMILANVIFFLGNFGWLPTLIISLPILFGIIQLPPAVPIFLLGMAVWLSAGFQCRSVIHSLFEARLESARGSAAGTLVTLIALSFIGLWVSLDITPQIMVWYIIAFLLGFWGLDFMIRLSHPSAAQFRYGMRPTLTRA